jgi:hypothetical protein
MFGISPDTLKGLRNFLKDILATMYATMREQMIYGESLEPVKLFERISELQQRFNTPE